MATGNDNLFRELFRDELTRLSDSILRLEGKVDKLADSTSDDFKDIHSLLHSKFVSVDEKIHDHTEKLIKHEQSWNIASWIFTAGSASLIGFVAWIWDQFNIHK